MLIEFRVENHRSLRDEQVLTMEAGRVGDQADPRPRHIGGTDLELLPVVALYGANASGKTNVLDALAFMRDAVLNSANRWQPDGAIPRTPFAWSTAKRPSSFFEVAIVVNSIRYEYGFQLSDDVVIEEWLFAWPHGNKQTWFERENGSFKFGDKLKGENKAIEGVTRANALFLSTAMQFGQLQLLPIFAWFRSLELLNLGAPASWLLSDFENLYAIAELFDPKRPRAHLGLSDNGGGLRDRFIELMRNADLGIVDLKVDQKIGGGRMPAAHVHLKHQKDDEEAWLPLSQESKGTQTLFRSALPILRSLHTGGVVLCDELESSLHPVLAQTIVRQFADPITNPHNAQLIFTTHDTNLLGTTMGEPALRRDQVWLTEKDAEGATVLYPLTDFKPRKSENLERGYIQGRYGAIPFLGDFTLAAE